MRRLSKPADYVLFMFAFMLSTGKGFKLFDNHRGLLAYNKDSGWIENLMAGLVEVYAFQLRNYKSGLKSREELMKPAQVYPNGVKANI